MLINLIKKVFQNGRENPVLAEDFNTMQENIETAINTAAGFIAKDADVYDATLTYKVGALVINENKLYECITEITTAEAWDSAKWKETNLKAIIATKQKILTPGENITIKEDGTISASGGGDAETITNTNGTAIKFADGTMICTKKVSFSNVQFANQQGNLYFCQELRLGNTPENFISTPNAFINVTEGWGTIAGVKYNTASNFGKVQLFRGDNSNQSTITIEVMAIGRWKV